MPPVATLPIYRLTTIVGKLVERFEDLREEVVEVFVLVAADILRGDKVGDDLRVNKSPPSSHRGEEFVYVLEGRLRLSVGEQTYSVGPSESIVFWSGERHSYAPDDCPQATILSVRVDY